MQRADVDRGDDDPVRKSDPLARAAARGDPDAYRALMMRHADRLHGFSTRLLGDAAEAEDVTQESFARLWRALTVNPPKGPVPAWLYRTARNLCIDRIRKRRHLAATPPDPETAGADPTPGAEAQHAAADRAAAVNGALQALPERQRAALALVHYDGMSGRDAAAVLDVSEEALESLLARGRRGLRQALAPIKEDL